MLWQPRSLPIDMGRWFAGCMLQSVEQGDRSQKMSHDLSDPAYYSHLTKELNEFRNV